MSKQWNIKTPNPQLQVSLSNTLGVHPIVAQLLVNRNIVETEDARQFLAADLQTLHDPFLFKNMRRAVDRILQARDRKERVLVFGDYDVDGVTSSALLHGLFTGLGIEVLNHIPHRMEDGYGLNEEIAQYAHGKNIKLLVTIDCGISAIRPVEKINSFGIDTIIFDHHEPGPDLPAAFAIVNPKQKDCPYPFKHLASVGLAAKLIQAVLGRVDEETLDLVALGTIADVVPLLGENRVFVKQGLPRISSTRNKGLAALLESAKIKNKKMKPYYVGFILGPRINAMGRMDSAHKSLDLLLSRDDGEAQALACVLEEHNTRRQKMQSEMIQEALDIVEQEINFKDQKVIVLSREGWHKGVLGIVASRISEKYYRPAVVISLQDGVGTASARSIDGFHLYEALARCSHVLEDFGGHEGAAGLRIRAEQVDAFRDLINKVADEILEIKALVPALSIDCEIPLSSVDMDLAEIIEAMEPFGEGNPTPVFCSRQLTVKSRPAILGRETLKFWVSDGEKTFPAVGFGMAKFAPLVNPGERIDLAYEISLDDWNKSPSVQLMLKDMKASDALLDPH